MFVCPNTRTLVNFLWCRFFQISRGRFPKITGNKPKFSRGSASVSRRSPSVPFAPAGQWRWVTCPTSIPTDDNTITVELVSCDHMLFTLVVSVRRCRRPRLQCAPQLATFDWLIPDQLPVFDETTRSPF